MTEGCQQLRLVDHHEVFFVAGAGAAGPVEAAVEQQLAVEQGELVVHMVGAGIDAQRHAFVAQPLHVAASVELFFVVADHPHGHAALMTNENFLAKRIVGDGVDTDIHALARLAAQLADLPAAVFARAEVGAGDNTRRRDIGVQGFDHLLQPLQRRLGVLRLADQLTHQSEGAVAHITHLVGAQLAAELTQLVTLLVAQA